MYVEFGKGISPKLNKGGDNNYPERFRCEVDNVVTYCTTV